MKKIIIVIENIYDIIKIQSLYFKLKEEFEVSFIFNIEDEQELISILNHFNLPNLFINLNVHNNNLDNLVKLYEKINDNGKIIDYLMDGKFNDINLLKNKIKLEFDKIKPDYVLLFNGITSLISSLVSKNMNIFIGHFESGIRNGNLNDGNEVCRILIDNIVNYHFITDDIAFGNLNGIVKDNNYIIGDLMGDIVQFKNKFIELDVDNIINMKKKEYILIILDQDYTDDFLTEMHNDISKLDVNVKIFIYVNNMMKDKMDKLGLLNKFDNMVSFIKNKLQYLDLLNLISRTKFLVTDSSNLVEMTNGLRILCFYLSGFIDKQYLLIEHGGVCKLVGEFKDVDVKFVSLGMNCMIGIILQNIGLKKYSYPFDWINSSLKNNIDIINDNFKNFLNKKNYVKNKYFS